MRVGPAAGNLTEFAWRRPCVALPPDPLKDCRGDWTVGSRLARFNDHLYLLVCWYDLNNLILFEPGTGRFARHRLAKDRECSRWVRRPERGEIVLADDDTRIRVVKIAELEEQAFVLKGERLR